MKTRKIVQIVSTNTIYNNRDGYAVYHLLALDDEGDIWRYDYDSVKWEMYIVGYLELDTEEIEE